MLLFTSRNLELVDAIDGGVPPGFVAELEFPDPVNDKFFRKDDKCFPFPPCSPNTNSFLELLYTWDISWFFLPILCVELGGGGFHLTRDFNLRFWKGHDEL
jgi:hypothetical protein